MKRRPWSSRARRRRPGASERIGAERIASYHDFTRRKGVNWLIYFLAPRDPPARLPDLAAARAARPRARQGHRGRPDRRLQPPQLPRPLRPRRVAAVAAPAALRRQGRALRAALAGMDPEPPRRLPGSPRRGRPRHGRDLAGDPRARRRGLHLPRGHADPPRVARRSAPRRRPARARDRGRGHPGRRATAPSTSATAGRSSPRKVRLRAGKALTFPQDREPLAVAGRDRHRPDLAQHRAAVGVARRAAADAQGGRDRRRQLGHRGGGAARARRGRGPARLPHRRAGRRDREAARELLPARASRSETRSRSSAPPTSRSPASTSSASRSPRRRFRPPSARSPTGSAPAPRSCCSRRASCRRSARCPASTSTSASAPARSPRSAAPRTPRRRRPEPRRWRSRAATRTCARSSATSSTAPG